MTFPRRVDSFRLWAKAMENAAQVPENGRPGKASLSLAARRKRRPKRKRRWLKRKKKDAQNS